MQHKHTVTGFCSGKKLIYLQWPNVKVQLMNDILYRMTTDKVSGSHSYQHWGSTLLSSASSPVICCC